MKNSLLKKLTLTKISATALTWTAPPGCHPICISGCFQPRAAIQAGFDAEKKAPDQFAATGASTWINELIWREFFIHVLYHHPKVMHQSYRPELRAIAWRNAPGELEAWKYGQTGCPIVDAGMRQLLNTGWMHNRVRMIAASYLVKDLLIDWREGERWFAERLIDYDAASNNGGWQWTAGTGTDAAPYFRIFNPSLQGGKFDPEGSMSGGGCRSWPKSQPGSSMNPGSYR